MKEKTLTFGTPKNITGPGQDGVVYEFPFSTVDSEQIGSPEEQQVTTAHCLTVECVRSRCTAWKRKLSEGDLQKVLFEIGRRELLKRAAAEGLKGNETVIVHTRTHGATPPFDPSRIPEPNGVIVTVQAPCSRIGFR